MIRAAFLGTPGEAVPVLDGLIQVAHVVVVITQPDKPRGRSGRLQPPAVKVAAEARGLTVAQPARLGGVTDLLEETDVAVLAAYGRLVPPAVLATPRRGFLNVHFSLLPRWRGASPVVRAILAGDVETGVTLMQMDQGLDTGPIITAERTAISHEETAGDLTDRLAALGGGMVARSLPGWVAGELTPTAQDDRLATAAGKVTGDEAFVSPRLHKTKALVRAVRAYNPKPGAWAVVDGERFKVWRALQVDGAQVEPGMAVVEGGRVLLGCADGVVELLRVQPAGRAEMDALAWMNGRRAEPARFEAARSRGSRG
ncbi:MAG: methionyl-tRNA formyltransferase [Actinomycetota bacterium]